LSGHTSTSRDHATSHGGENSPRLGQNAVEVTDGCETPETISVETAVSPFAWNMGHRKFRNSFGNAVSACLPQLSGVAIQFRRQLGDYERLKTIRSGSTSAKAEARRRRTDNWLVLAHFWHEKARLLPPKVQLPANLFSDRNVPSYARCKVATKLIRDGCS
jgi:hypothetical protein